jgi:hypothetical protein
VLSCTVEDASDGEGAEEDLWYPSAGHEIRSVRIEAYPRYDSRPVVKPEALNYHHSTIASQEDANRAQSEEQASHATDLRPAISNRHRHDCEL